MGDFLQTWFNKIFFSFHFFPSLPFLATVRLLLGNIGIFDARNKSSHPSLCCCSLCVMIIRVISCKTQGIVVPKSIRNGNIYSNIFSDLANVFLPPKRIFNLVDIKVYGNIFFKMLVKIFELISCFLNACLCNLSTLVTCLQLLTNILELSKRQSCIAYYLLVKK